MKQDIKNTLDICLNSYISKLLRASEKIEKIAGPLDALLDKPVSEDNPKYVCGDALEEIKEVIDDTILQLGYTKNIVMAKVGAWGLFPDDDLARHGYTCGYMDAKDNNE